YYNPDVYYQPEAFGLTAIGELSREPDYDFYMLVVWEHEDGRLFWATDTGCSCPSPFEDFTSLDHLSGLTLDSYGDFKAEVDEFPVDNADKTQLLAKVSKLLRG